MHLDSQNCPEQTCTTNKLSTVLYSHQRELEAHSLLSLLHANSSYLYNESTIF